MAERGDELKCSALFDVLLRNRIKAAENETQREWKKKSKCVD